MPSASTVAELAVVISADTTQVDRGLTDLDKKVSGIGGALQTAFAGAAVAGVAALGGALAVSVSSAADFEKQMSAIAAVSGSTEAEMDALTQTALQLGKDTSFSAKEAAAGMEELVKAGVSVTDTIGGGARAALDLAAAGGVAVADAAEIASNAMNVFNLTGADMAHVADQIAGAANASAIGVNDYKFSLSAAGAVAATVGVGFEDLTTAIAAMGNAGIKGSDAGTSLKTMLMNLQPSTNAQRDEFRRLGLETHNLEQGLAGVRKLGVEPLTNDWPGLNAAMMKHLGLSENVAKWSEKDHQAFEKLSQQLGATGSAFFDANGKAKSMADIAQVLQTATEGMTEAQRLASLEILFGSDALRAAAVLSKEGAAGMNELAASIGKVGATEVGEKRLDNLSGSLEKLKGSLETAAITIGMAITPALKELVDALTAAANEAMPAVEQAAKDVAATLQAWMPTIKAVVGFLWEHRDAIAAVVAALATFAILTTVVGWIAAIGGAIAAVTTAISASGGIIAALTALVALLGGPVTLIIAAVAVAVGVLAYAWAENWGDIQGKTEAVVEFLSTLPDTISGYWDAIATATDGLVTAVTDAWESIETATTDIWNGITRFLVDWWREILVALTGPVGLLAVLVIDNWEAIKTVTETIFQAIANILTAIWTAIYDTIIAPKLAEIKTAVETAWEGIRGFIEEKITAVQTTLSTAWEAITRTATESLNALLTFVRDTIFEPIRAAIQERIEAARDLVGAAWTAIKTTAETVLNPLLAYLRDTIFTPIQTVVETASTAISTAFTTAVNAVKTAVDTTMGSVKTAWETTWTAIKTAAESPKAAMDVLIGLVEKLKSIMPEWLIPHSPTPFQVGIEGILKAAKAMDQQWRSVASAVKGANGEIAEYVASAAAARGIDPSIALRVAMTEGGLSEYNKVGKFNTGYSWWPFQLHYAMAGAPGVTKPTKGMGDTFTKETGWAPGDPKAWKDSVDYALDHARRYGWGAWYGASNVGITGFMGIARHAEGGIFTKPHLAWIAERGPEAVVPLGRSGGPMALQTVRVDVAIGGRVAEEIYVTGRDLAIRRGRAPAGAA